MHEMDDIISWLTGLIDFDTTPEGSGAEACARFISRILSEHNVDNRLFTTLSDIRKGHHLLAEVPGKSSEAVMLHAHLDTADYGEPKDWLFPAGRSTHRHGVICGRGAIDCKGPLAVWMKLLCDAANKSPLPFSLKLLVSDLEEQGDKDGLGQLLAQHPELISNVKLVIGEGGGYPFPFEESLYFTFQTGERASYEEKKSADNIDPGTMEKTLSLGVEKGYYSKDILAYAAQADSLTGRRIDVRPLYDGMNLFFREVEKSDLYQRFGPVFLSALREEIPNARLMPYITPGQSDNRWFRNAGLPVIGFFPLDVRNSPNGIHGCNEYISEDSLRLAYRTMSRLLSSLYENT